MIRQTSAPRKKPGHWNSKENRVQAVRELVERLGKPVDKVRKRDFIDHGLSGLLSHFRGSVSRALLEAELSREKIKRENGHWESQENRIKAVQELVSSLEKRPAKITKKDFRDHHLSMLFRYGSLQVLLEEAGFSLKRKKKPQGYWNSQENRIAAIRNMVRECGKNPRDISKKDFLKYGLGSLLTKYHGSLWHALEDAGFRGVRRRRPPGYWNSQENRVEAVLGLLQTLGKPSAALRRQDFVDHGLGSLLNRYRDEQCKGFCRPGNPDSKGYLLEHETETQRALAEAGILS